MGTESLDLRILLSNLQWEKSINCRKLGLLMQRSMRNASLVLHTSPCFTCRWSYIFSSKRKVLVPEFHHGKYCRSVLLHLRSLISVLACTALAVPCSSHEASPIRPSENFTDSLFVTVWTRIRRTSGKILDPG